MSDFAVTYGTAGLDMSIENNDLAGDDGLDTAVLISLFTDRRAEDGDDLPSGETNRRGYWADQFNSVKGDRFGSRLWLLSRTKRTPDSASRIEGYAREALAWLIEDGVTDQIDVTVSFPTRDSWALGIVIYRPHKDPAKYRFTRTWDAQG